MGVDAEALARARARLAAARRARACSLRLSSSEIEKLRSDPQAQELLAAEASERGKQVVLIIDEAHLLDAESLEGVRCLSNLGMDQTAPFCLLLLGQPTLRRRLRHPPPAPRSPRSPPNDTLAA